MGVNEHDEDSQLPIDDRLREIQRVIKAAVARMEAGEQLGPRQLFAAHRGLMPELATAWERAMLARDPSIDPGAATLAPNSPDHPPADPGTGRRNGPEIPGYRIVRKIQAGGQGVVYEAIQRSTGLRVAVKVTAHGAFDSARERARFKLEAQILTALNHPSIVRIIARGTTGDGAQFFAMEYVEGCTLGEYLGFKSTLPAAEERDSGHMLRVFVQITEAVNAAHLRGVVHRDLKPGNIMIDAEGHPHILDFGLARTALTLMTDESKPHEVTITGQFLGSLPWASPEQAAGHTQQLDPRTDVYSLGVILYQCLTVGAFPYEVAGTMQQVLHNIIMAEPTPPSAVLATREATAARRRRRRTKHRSPINPTIEAIVLKALAKQRHDRYQTAGELARDITNYLAGRPTVAEREYLSLRRTRWLRWLWQRAGRTSAAVAALGLLVLGLAWLLRGTSERRFSPTNPIAVSALPQLDAAARLAKQARSRANLQALARAMMLYAADWRESYPPNFDPLFAYMDPKLLLSPLEHEKLPQGYYTWSDAQRSQWVKRNCSYIVLAFGKRMAALRYDAVMAFEAFAPEKTGTAVLFADGKTDWIAEDEARALIQRQTGKTIEQLAVEAERYR